jgi:hypothetical protein
VSAVSIRADRGRLANQLILCRQCGWRWLEDRQWADLGLAEATGTEPALPGQIAPTIRPGLAGSSPYTFASRQHTPSTSMGVIPASPGPEATHVHVDRRVPP